MVRFATSSYLTVALLCCTVLTFAQQSPDATNNSVVPTQIRFSGTLNDAGGKPLAGITGVTFSLYRDSQGGAPLWIETQNVEPDSAGHYSVMLGSTTSTGLPVSLFAAGEARWLGIQPHGQTEQRRVLLVSVPYAMKAGDAETIHGMPPSAFVLSTPSPGSNSGIAASSSAGTIAPTGSGTIDFLPLWTSSSNLGNSIVFENPTSLRIGINTNTPATTLDVKGAGTVRGLFTLPATGTATATSGTKSQALDLTASSFNSSKLSAVNQNFFLQAEPSNNNSANASGTLNLLFAAGTATPVETGLRIGSNGQITFASGQTFPGTGSGTVTSVGLSAPTSDFTISGSPVTHSGTLNLAWKTAPTSAPTPNAIVKRDASGNFASAGVTAGASSFVANNTTQVVSVTQNGSGAALSAFSAVANGIVGQTTGAGRQSGVLGIAGTATSFSIGVQGQAQSTNGTGMLGLSSGSAGIGVTGRTTGTSGIGVAAAATATSGATQALFARVFSPSGIAGVFDNAGAGQILSLRNKGVEKVAVQNNGIVQIGTTSTNGMLNAVASSQSLVGLYANGWNAPVNSGLNAGTAIVAAGGTGDLNSGTSGGTGIVASGGGGFNETAGGPGIVASGGGPAAFGGAGGIFNGASGKDADGDGIDARPGSNAGGAYAGNFQGDINVSGAIFAGTKDFRIDHPLDPANKYLLHASVESSEMKNMYDGLITLDANGQAQVTLPPWFEAVNDNFRYQLTAVGRSSPGLYIAEEISNEHFRIAGGVPGTKVSWQVTGVRKDAYAKAHPLVIEQLKNARERGHYIHPELYGAPEERDVEWARNPAWTKYVKELRSRHLAAVQAGPARVKK